MYHQNDARLAQEFIYNNFGIEAIIEVDDSLPVMLPVDVELTQEYFKDPSSGVIF